MLAALLIGHALLRIYPPGRPPPPPPLLGCRLAGRRKARAPLCPPFPERLHRRSAPLSHVLTTVLRPIQKVENAHGLLSGC